MSSIKLAPFFVPTMQSKQGVKYSTPSSQCLEEMGILGGTETSPDKIAVERRIGIHLALLNAEDAVNEPSTSFGIECHRCLSSLNDRNELVPHGKWCITEVSILFVQEIGRRARYEEAEYLLDPLGQIIVVY